MFDGELDSSSLVGRWRRGSLEFLMNAAAMMQVAPIVKYTALSLFADRFLPSLRSGTRESLVHSWLMNPLRESNLQLFVLISVWISSKSHDTSPISSKTIKSFADRYITDQHFTMGDFVEAEIIFMEALNYGIGSINIAFVFLEEFLIQFRAISKGGELVSSQACMDLMDLLYETEEAALLFSQPRLLAAVILVTSYVLTVPSQSFEFPLLPWVKFESSYDECHVIRLVEQVLAHILIPIENCIFDTVIG